MFQAVEIDPVWSWDDVIGTVRETASIWILNFLTEVKILISAG
jgi:type IV secretory pathway TrbF-like protein